jgi:DNA polymerase-1
MARIGPGEVRARYGVDPEQVPDFVALRRDPSDKLPGAPGVGSVGAAALLHRYGTLEKALAAERFPAQALTRDTQITATQSFPGQQRGALAQGTSEAR